MESVRDHPPFGDFHGMDRGTGGEGRHAVVFHTTSGTTGDPQPIFYGAWDREVQNALLARTYRLHGAARRRRGALGLRVRHGERGGTTSARRSCTSPGRGCSHPRHRARHPVGRAGRADAPFRGSPFSSGSRTTSCVSRRCPEPRASSPPYASSPGISARRAVPRFRRRGAARQYSTGTGVADTGCIAAESPSRDGLHVFEDAHFVELLDPESDSGRTAPAGEPGALCTTVLFKDTVYPVIRFDTRDMTRVLPPDPGSGIGFRRITGFEGRADAMVKLRGINVYPPRDRGAPLADRPALAGRVRLPARAPRGADSRSPWVAEVRPGIEPAPRPRAGDCRAPSRPPRSLGRGRAGWGGGRPRT